MAYRECENCHRKMEPYRSRLRNEDGLLVCEGCANGREGRPLTGMKIAKKAQPGTIAKAPFARLAGIGLVKLAHDSGDGETIYHCPFCGSGQVVARSDGTTECEFCHNCFIVQVQPSTPEMPQTINGQPYQIPGMPERSTETPADNPIQNPEDPNAQPEVEDAGGEGGAFGGDSLSDKVNGNDEIQASAALVTADGYALSKDSYLAHLALRHSDDPAKTLDEVRRQNRGE